MAEPDWPSFHELAIYALYPLTPHGEIDPFAYIGRHYIPGNHLDLRAVYFDDPRKFAHVDREGILSVSQKGAPGRVDLALPLERLDEALISESYAEAVNSWKSFFIEPTPCAQCEAWRICMGTFSGFDNSECSKILTEVLEGIERAQAAGMVMKTWQHS
jgi:hypothetical protein